MEKSFPTPANRDRRRNFRVEPGNSTTRTPDLPRDKAERPQRPAGLARQSPRKIKAQPRIPAFATSKQTTQPSPLTTANHGVPLGKERCRGSPPAPESHTRYPHHDPAGPQHHAPDTRGLDDPLPPFGGQQQPLAGHGPQEPGAVDPGRAPRQQPDQQDGHPLVGGGRGHVGHQQRVLRRQRGDGRGVLPAGRVGRADRLWRAPVRRVGARADGQDPRHSQRRARRPHAGCQDAHQRRAADGRRRRRHTRPVRRVQGDGPARGRGLRARAEDGAGGRGQGRAGLVGPLRGPGQAAPAAGAGRERHGQGQEGAGEPQDAAADPAAERGGRGEDRRLQGAVDDGLPGLSIGRILFFVSVLLQQHAVH